MTDWTSCRRPRRRTCGTSRVPCARRCSILPRSASRARPSPTSRAERRLRTRRYVLVFSTEPSSRAPSGTLLPGFIDCHVHLGFFQPRAVLRGGVTTVRDLGWPLDVALDGGPDVLRAVQILTAPGGYPLRAGWAPKGTARE